MSFKALSSRQLTFSSGRIYSALMATGRILITGGAGFIGSSVADLLIRDGAKVIIADDLSRGSREAIPQGAVFHEVAIQETAKIHRILQDYQIDSVMHFAAFIKVGESIEKPELYFANNTEGTRSLLKALDRTAVKNFVFSSTAAVYGQLGDGIVTESSLLAPLNPYGQSKLQAEGLIRDYTNQQPALRSLILRYFNVAGADASRGRGPRDPQATHLIRRTAQTALKLIPSLGVFGRDYATADGTCIRDYIHIKDLAQAHLQGLEFLQKKEAATSVTTLNLGYGKGFSVLDVIQAMEKATGLKVPSHFQERRPGDPACVIADSSRAQTLLNLQWRYQDLGLICKDTLQWESQLASRQL